MTIIITLSFAGNETGPFDLYSDATGFAIPFAQNVSKAALLAGYQVEAPDGTTVVRLDNLNSLCGSTDIYSCATPNCDFTGSIICDVTTTTTTTAEPTTTTTTAYPSVAPCTWSTYGGNPGEIAVYDFDTSSSTVVLVPNDFTATTGINRPICSTGDKLWMTSVLIEGDESLSDDIMYIREWDINTSGATPTLSYVREITVNVGGLSKKSSWGTEITAIAVTGDNNTLLAGFGAKDNGENGMGVYSWDISTSGDIALNENNKIDNAATPFGNPSGITTELTGMFITNDNNVILSARYYENTSPTFASNRIKQFQGLPSNVWLDQYTWPVINLQQSGVPEFTSAWTNPSKAMPAWGVNGLLQVIQPETLEVYNISQTATYDATLATTVADDTVWIHTSTGCANVDIIYEDCEDATWIPALTEQVDGEWVYTGPATFTYAGIEVTASASQDNMQLRSGNTSGGIPPEGCSGISNPPANSVLTSLRGSDFTITLSFAQPVNNIPIRAAVLNTQPDFSVGDVYTFDTNTGTPNVSISVGCNVQVQGNSIGGGVPDYGTEGDGEFIITSDTPFTILTISGDAPTGGPLLLGCIVPPLNCRLVYSTDNASNSCLANPGRCLPGQNSFKKYFAWNVNTNTQQEVLLPPSTATNSPNFALSENYIIVDVTSLVTGVKSLARYGYTDINGIPSDTTFDGQFIDYPAGDVRDFGSIMEAVTDTKFLGLWLQSFSQPFPTAVSQILEWELSGTTLSYSVKIDVGVNHGYFLEGDLLLTFKTDGTPNKIIAVGFVPPLQQDNSNPAYLLQFDYTTNALDGVVNLPAGVRGTASLGIYDGGIYIAPSDNSTVSPELAGVWRFDLETLQWTQLDPADVPVEMGLPSATIGDFASTPTCRVSDGITSFDPPPTTTTTSTTAIPEGINTIWTWFEGEAPA